MALLTCKEIRAVKVLEALLSKTNPLLIQEYVEGINLEKVLSSKNPLGLDRKMIAEIKRKRDILFKSFEQIRSQALNGNDPASELSWRDLNVLYEFSTGDLVVIDGR